jgi:hypothetical protein
VVCENHIRHAKDGKWHTEYVLRHLRDSGEARQTDWTCYLDTLWQIRNHASPSLTAIVQANANAWRTCAAADVQWLSCSSAFSFLSTANKGRRTLPTLTPQSDILLLARLCSTRSCCLITYIVHHPSNFFFPEGAINPFSFHFSDIQVGSFPPCVAFW